MQIRNSISWYVVVVVYPETIIAIGHGLLKKCWPMATFYALHVVSEFKLRYNFIEDKYSLINLTLITALSLALTCM